MSRESADSGTVCPECAVGCRLAAGEGERAVGRVGPANPNGRLCQHGVGALDSVADRLTEPQVRRDGDLVAVSWERALDRVAAEFRAHRQATGPDSLAVLGAPHSTNEENYLLSKLARTLGTNNVDNRARLCHTETTRALDERFGRPAATNSLADLSDAETILVVGANPAQRQPVAFNSAVRPAVNDGTTLIHVDPVGNETTRLADLHIAPRPGMDAVVCDLLSAGLLEAGAVDERFVAERTTGFEGFRSELLALDTERASEVAGVDRETLDRAVAAIGDRTAAITGTGIEGARGASAPDALLNLLLLTGNVGSRGTGLHLFRGLANEQGALDAGCVPDWLPGHQPITDDDARTRFEAAWGVELPAAPGPDANGLLGRFGSEIRGALVVGENPAVVKRDREWVTARLDALETLVCVDIAPNETTPYADVVLPAATLLETDGTITNLDRQIQRLRPLRSPPGSARPERTIVQELGSRLLGETITFEYDSARAVFAEMSQLTEIFGSYPDDAERWPDGEAVCYRERFETATGTAAFAPLQQLPSTDQTERLELVVSGRTGDPSGVVPTEIEIHPKEASKRGIAAGTAVVLAGEGATVRATAVLNEAVRTGTVSVHATVADPLVREGANRVTLSAATTAPQSR